MQIVSVKQYTAPRYPDKPAVIADHELLYRLPERWKKSAAAVAALTAAVGMLSGCTAPELKTFTGEGRVAPVFERGEGYGSYGCVSVTQPVFLSEEDAVQVIVKTAQAKGLASKTVENKIIKEMDLPGTNIYDRELLKTQKGDLMLDGYIGAENILFEYVSKQDYSQWKVDVKTEKPYLPSSNYYIKTTAQLLEQGLKGHTDGQVVVVFYDPVYQSKLLQNDSYNRRHLAAQVRDFIQWLKAEEII